MKILVTGSTGFVGSHLCDELVAKGHDVYAQARNKKKFEEFNIKGQFIPGDFNPENDLKWVHDLPHDLDTVIHTAGIPHSQNIRDFYQINTKGNRRLIEALKQKYPRKLNYILISSLAAAGPNLEGEDFILEDRHPGPVSHYGKSKHMAEMDLKQLAPLTWKKVAIRPPMIIGPRDPAVLDVFKMVKWGVAIAPGHKGAQKRYSFIAAYDLVKLIMATLEDIYCPYELDIIFSAHPRPITFDMLVESIAKALKKKKPLQLEIPMGAISLLAKTSQILRIPSRATVDKVHEMKPHAWICSSQKSIDVLGMNYEWDLEKIVEHTTQDYLRRGWL